MQELHINHNNSDSEYHTIERTIKTNNQTIYFKLLGEPFSSKIDKEKINTLLNNIFLNKILDTNIEDIIRYIRIILKDYTEKYLVVEVKDHKENKIYNVILENKRIKKFNLKQHLEISKSFDSNLPIDIIIKYDGKKKSVSQILRHPILEYPTLDFSSKRKEAFLQNRIHTTAENLTQSLLISVSKINSPFVSIFCPVTDENEILAQSYESFFSEVPDFSKEETYNNFITMFEIINQCGLDIFKSNESNKILEKYNNNLAMENLQKTATYLAPYGKLDDLVGWNTIDEQTKEKLESLADKIERFSSTYESKEQVLQNIKALCEYKLLSRLTNDSNYLQERNYLFTSGIYPYEISKIASYINCNEEETRALLKLLEELSQENTKLDIENKNSRPNRKVKMKQNIFKRKTL